MSIIDEESVSNDSGNEHFRDILEARLSRRGFLTSGVAAAAAVSLGGLEALLKAVPASAQETVEGADDEKEKVEPGGRRRPVLGFESVPVSSADEVVVPKGYTAEVLIAWGDPVSSGPALNWMRVTRPMSKLVSGVCITTESSTFRSSGPSVG